MNVWRIQRATAIGIGVMLILVPPLGVGTMIREAASTAPWWTPVSIVLLVVSGLGLIAVATERFRRYLAPMMAVAAGVQLLIIALWFPAHTHVLADSNSINPLWVTAATSLVGVGLVTTANYWVALAYVIVQLSLASIAYSHVHSGQWVEPAESMRALISGSLVGVFLVVVREALVVARKVDDERAQALENAAVRAARSARALERQRIDVVVRDEVIAVLRTIEAGAPEPVQREQALRALAVLDGSEAERPSTLTPELAQRRLRQAVIDYGDQIAVAIEVDETADDYPVGAVDAVIDASGEAIVNSLQHAGPHASQAVVGQLTAQGIRLRIVDDGQGFNPDRVPGDRMGIEVGIRQRMRAVPGGSAAIDSVHHDGTMVSLEWRR